MFQGPLDYSIIKRAKDKRQVEIDLVNIRDFGIGGHKQVDDSPYGGGTGMVLRVDVLSQAIKYAKALNFRNKISRNHSIITRGKESAMNVVLLSASGAEFTQLKAKALAKFDHLILVCGHYEGVDARVMKYIDEEISVGDFITTGGEIPAMLIADSVIRLLPGIFKSGVTESESFSLSGVKEEVYLEYPQYTKPAVFDETSVPEILLSGDHKRIQEWRMQEARKKTEKLRPDLLIK